MNESLITSPLGVLAILAGVASFFFFLEKKTSWKIFNFFPPLLFIYTVPVIFSNTGLMVNESPVYSFMGDTVLPMFLIIMLLDVDVKSAVRVMGKGIFVMLFGTVGVIIGAPIAYFAVKSGLGPEAWKGFGALAGSWIGGTGNMAAVSEGLKTPGEAFGLAVIADNVVYLIWLPLMLSSKSITKWFSKFAKVDKNRIEMLEKTSGELAKDKGKLEMRHLLYLLFFGLFFAWLAGKLAGYMPTIPPVLTASSWKILLVTTFGISLSMPIPYCLDLPNFHWCSDI